MRSTSIRRGVVLLAGATMLTAGACSSGDAEAPVDTEITPPPASQIVGTQPVLAVDIVQGLQEQPVDVEVDGDQGVAVTFREITIAAGTSTARHCHHGQLIAVVKQGEITHYSDTFAEGSHTFRAGDSIVEGAGYPHEARNEGTEDVILMVTYVTPVGKPIVEEDLSQCE
ncbi:MULTISPECIES: cupin domain-containing protein [Dietzia]|uniref:cupin domain-containing protein n=1 Tax=Dietzia TaxID=37914 RepID=UPI0015FAF83A|nr:MULTISPECIES: cupin domain-containing protein [Dietzia]MBB1020417.1 cupin domain-containing protein [Dietzia sp. E1]MCT1641404.1 cupin domain-containing protein [Dietzia cinnamea]